MGLFDKKYIEIGLIFEKPSQVDLKNINKWLSHLACEDSRLNVVAKDATAAWDITHDYLYCALYLSKILYQLACLPIFDDLIVKKLTNHGAHLNIYDANISVPIIDSIGISVYTHVLRESINITNWLNQNNFSDEMRQRGYETIQERVLSPLKGKVPGGKSTIPVLRVAHALDIPFQHLGMGVYQIGWGSKSRRLDRGSSDKDSAIGARLAQNKVVSAKLLRAAGLPASQQSVFSSLSELAGFGQQMPYPVVVKPSDRDRGEGVTVDIVDDISLRQAFRKAHSLSQSKHVVIEPQAPGVCHRIFVANGELLYAVKRHPMSVSADGTRTIRQLVHDELAVQASLPPWKRSEIKPIDGLATEAIKKLGFNLDSVPPKGILVPLRRIESTEWGGIDEEVTDIVHPENLNIALQAAKLFGLDMAGVDMITLDVSRPWYENAAIINEVNYVPLLGGAEISRSYLPTFFKRFIKDDGRIPIMRVSTEAEARLKQTDLVDMGQRCYVIDDEKTWDHMGRLIHSTCRTKSDRINALLCNRDVDALILIGSDF